MNDVNLDELVKTYLTIRDERDRLSREHDAKDRELANDLAQLEQVLLNSCNEINADSIRTGNGSIYMVLF